MRCAGLSFVVQTWLLGPLVIRVLVSLRVLRVNVCRIVAVAGLLAFWWCDARSLVIPCVVRVFSDRSVRMQILVAVVAFVAAWRAALRWYVATCGFEMFIHT